MNLKYLFINSENVWTKKLSKLLSDKKIFRMNDYHWVVAEDANSALDFYKNFLSESFGKDSPDYLETLDETYVLQKEMDFDSMRKATVFDEDSNKTDNFFNKLIQDLNNNVSRPYLFASSEY